MAIAAAVAVVASARPLALLVLLAAPTVLADFFFTESEQNCGRSRCPAAGMLPAAAIATKKIQGDATKKHPLIYVIFTAHLVSQIKN